MKYFIYSLSLLALIISAIIIIDRKEFFLPSAEFTAYKTTGKTIPPSGKFNDKIWLHRVNSVEKMKKYQYSYTGLEIDVHYDFFRKFFYVSHDEDASVNLSIEHLFQSLQSTSDHYFWIDYKNLNNENREESLNLLMNIAKKYEIPHSHIVVESSETECLSVFSENGFQTSYYLPRCNPYTASKESMLKLAKEIDGRLQKSKVNYVSAYYYEYAFIKFYFPETNMLLWYTRDNPLKAFFVKNKLEKDDKVKVILLSEYSFAK